MLGKYQHFQKLSQTEGCSLYSSQNRLNMQTVLLKRLKQQSTWDELFVNPNLIFMNKAQFAPKMVQIFKKKGYYFIVYDKPTGISLSQSKNKGKMPLDKFFPLFHDLCYFCIQLQNYSPRAYILPEWVFINRNSCKISHFQPFFQKEEDNNKHVFIYNLEKSIQMGSNNKLSLNSQIFLSPKNHSLIFNIGMIAYQLLTGTDPIQSQTQQQCELQQLEFLNSNFEQLFKITNNKIFSELISNAIKQGPFDTPTIHQIYNITKKIKKQYQPKQKKADPVIQCNLQKIQLIDKYKKLLIQKHKFIKPCCQTILNEQLDCEIKKSKNQTLSHEKRKKINSFYSYKKQPFLPQISTFKPQHLNKNPFPKLAKFNSEQSLRFDHL